MEIVMKLRVMSFNIRCCDDVNGNSIAERAPRLAKIISGYAPDVLGVQEYRPTWEEHFQQHFLQCLSGGASGRSRR